MASQLELEKLIDLGDKLGLKGTELKDFLDEERAKLKEERDIERDDRAKQRALELEQRALEIEQQDKDKELKEKLIILEIEAKERLEQEISKQLVLQLEIEKVKNENGNHGGGYNHSNKARTPKLPPFNQGKDDIDAYLHRFGLYATTQGWSKEYEWATSLAALLQGEGLFEYSALSPEDALNYDKVKIAVLKAYHLTTEGFKNKFREVKPNEGETGERFATRLQNYFRRWMELDKVDNFEKLQDMVLREQFLNSCIRDHATFLKERRPRNLNDMAKYANQYIEAHGGWHPGHLRNKDNSGKNRSNKSPNSSPTNSSVDKKSYVATNKGQSPQSSQNTTQRRNTCYICGKYGHYARDCTNRPTTAAMASINEFSEILHSMKQQLSSQNSQQQTQSECEVSPNYNYGIASSMIGQPEIHYDKAKQNGFVTLKCGHQLPILSSAYEGLTLQSMPVKEGKIGEHTVQVMRDSGCSSVVVNSKFLKPHQKTDIVHTCILIDGTVRRFPMCFIQVDTPYYKGNVKAYFVDKPICDLIIGNIPGARDPSDPDPNWNNRGKVNYVVKQEPKSSKDHVDKDQEVCAAIQIGKPFKKFDFASPIGEDVTTEEFIQKQQEDPSLSKVQKLAKSGKVTNGQGGIRQKYVKNRGILYRESVQRNTINIKQRQVVVPARYRSHVLKVAHQPIHKREQYAIEARDEVMNHFTWPGVETEVRTYSQSYDVPTKSPAQPSRVKQDCETAKGTSTGIPTPFDRGKKEQ